MTLRILPPLAAALPLWAAMLQAAPETDKEKLSYTIGVQMGRNLLDQPLVLDKTFLLQGVEDALENGELQLSDEQMRAVLADYRRAREQNQERAAAANEQASRDFLAANQDKEGVRTHASGLQYKVLQEGNGARPTAEDTITVHYEGRLIDGTVFDSSYARGEPVSLQLDRVIEGWRVALPLMSVGGKWRLFIPPELGYGSQGAGPDIGPNATIIFDVELMGID